MGCRLRRREQALIYFNLGMNDMYNASASNSGNETQFYERRDATCTVTYGMINVYGRL
jgi:hypothetical protein